MSLQRWCCWEAEELIQTTRHLVEQYLNLITCRRYEGRKGGWDQARGHWPYKDSSCVTSASAACQSHHHRPCLELRFKRDLLSRLGWVDPSHSVCLPASWPQFPAGNTASMWASVGRRHNAELKRNRLHGGKGSQKKTLFLIFHLSETFSDPMHLCSVTNIICHHIFCTQIYVFTLDSR